MILSVPLSIFFQVLFMNSDNADAAFMRPAPSFRQTQTSSSQLHVDPIVEAYRKRGKGPLDDINIPSTPAAPQEVAAVVTPEPIIATPDPVPDVTQSVPSTIDSIVQAVNNAASSAMEASQKATEAAASISPDVTASTSAGAAAATTTTLFPKAKAAAAAAAAAANSDQPKAPSLVEYFSSGHGLNDVQIPSDSTEKLRMLGSNFMKTGDSLKGAISPEAQEKLSAAASTVVKTTSSTMELTQATKQVAAGASAGAAAVVGSSPSFDLNSLNFNFDSMDIQTFINNLKFDQYGGWYATAFTFVYALSQKEAGRMEAERAYEAELALAREATQDAALAAIMAAEGAKAAKELVAEMANEDRSASKTQKSATALALEESKMKMAEVDLDMLKSRVAHLTNENREQKVTIEKLLAQTSVPTPASNKVSKAPVPVVKEKMDRDPDEDKKILEVLKGIDEENAAAKAADAAAEAKKALTAAKKTRKAAKKKKTKTKKKKVTAPEADESLVQEIMKIDADAETNDAADADSFFVKVVDDQIAKIATKPKKAPVKKKAPAMKTAEKKKKSPSKKKAKKKTPSKKIVVASKKGDPENPWGVLKESTLKRKTIAQLSAYLEEREVVIEGMSKTQLVGTIQTLELTP